MPLKCTNRSRPPSSGVMKPNPLSSLNHLTVPVAIYSPSMPRTIGRVVPTAPRQIAGNVAGTAAAARSAPLERGVAGTPRKEYLHGAAQVLRVEQPAGDLADSVVGELDAAVGVGPDDLLGGGMGKRRAVGQVDGERPDRGVEALVGKHLVDHVPALERGGVVAPAGHPQLECP